MLTKTLSHIKPSKVFQSFRMEAIGDAIVMTNASESYIASFQVPAEVIESGVVAPDLQMLRTLLKGIGDKTVELSLAGEMRLRVTFTAENGTESTYSLPVFDPDSTLASMVEDLKLEEAEPFAYFKSDRHLKQVLSSMKPLLGSHSYFNSFLFIPEDNCVRILTIRDPIVGTAEVPAEVPDEVVSRQEPLSVPRGIIQVPINSIAKLTRQRPWVIAISEQGFAALPTVDPEERHIISAALRLLSREADVSMRASKYFWRELRRVLTMHRSKKSYRYERPKIEFDFERERCYCWLMDGQPTIVSTLGEFPMVSLEKSREMPPIISFDYELVSEALEFINEPDTIEFLVISDETSAMRLRFGSWAVAVASLVKGSDFRTAQQGGER